MPRKRQAQDESTNDEKELDPKVPGMQNVIVAGAVDLPGEIASHDLDVFSIYVKREDPKNRDETQAVNFGDEGARGRDSGEQSPNGFRG
jgi:hypothetical protein